MKPSSGWSGSGERIWAGRNGNSYTIERKQEKETVKPARCISMEHWYPRWRSERNCRGISSQHTRASPFRVSNCQAFFQDYGLIDTDISVPSPPSPENVSIHTPPSQMIAQDNMDNMDLTNIDAEYSTSSSKPSPLGKRKEMNVTHAISKRQRTLGRDKLCSNYQISGSC